jgi:hypothetical protein
MNRRGDGNAVALSVSGISLDTSNVSGTAKDAGRLSFVFVGNFFLAGRVNVAHNFAIAL